MKMQAKRPIVVKGKVESGEFTTNEQHARELIAKGYAEPAGESAPKPARKKARKAKGEEAD